MAIYGKDKSRTKDILHMYIPLFITCLGPWHFTFSSLYLAYGDFIHLKVFLHANSLGIFLLRISRSYLFFLFFSCLLMTG